MPDPAIEAYKAGIPYVEPTGKGVRKAKVSYEWVRDPNDPTALPRQRRVIEPASKGSGFGKWWRGGSGDPGTLQAVPVQATPFQQQQQYPPGVSFDWLGRPKYPKSPRQPRFLPQPQTQTLDAQTQWATPPVLLQPTPMPANFDDLPWGERRYWIKMRDEQLKGIRLMEKAAKAQRKAQEKDQQLRQKAEAKQRKRELKAKEKELRWMRKHPQRYMPLPTPAPYPPATAPAAAPTAPAAPAPEPLSFMLTSTGEEFGVRRPFDAPGLPRSLGGPPGQAGWPMMSRTMTHAVQDLSREERVHAIQSGRAWAPNCFSMQIFSIGM